MKISAGQRRRLSRIAQKYDLRLVLAFGSSVTGQRHPRSDLDIAVRFDQRPVDFRTQAELSHELQKIFPELEVDLVILNYADPLFLKKITESCRLLYGDPREFKELKIYTFKRYQDHRRYFEMEQRFVEAFLKETSPTP